MSINNEIYDVVRRLQKEFPDLITLIPYITFASDDMYEVMYQVMLAAQERLEHEQEYPTVCESCCSEWGVVYCEACYDDLKYELHDAEREIDRLLKEIDKT